MGKYTKKPATPKPPKVEEELVKVTFTRAYNSGHAKYFIGDTIEVTPLFAKALKSKGVI